MKGKKTDSEFVSNFISDCINNNIVTANEILNLAKLQMSEIDKKIIEVENLKKLRSKLLDVVLKFENNKNDNSANSKLLPLFSIKNKNISYYVCNTVKEKPIIINCLYDKGFVNTEINFCIKQLLELKIIDKVGDYILPGLMFDNYINSVMCENI